MIKHDIIENMYSHFNFVGMEKNYALNLCAEHKIPYRIASDNEKIFILSMDLIPNRINFRIKNSIIIGYTLS